MDIVPAAPVVDSSSMTSTPTEPETSSLADHEAQFRPDAPRASETRLDEVEEADEESGRTRDKQGRYQKERHRAESQKATAADVPRIRELTKKLRDSEELSKKQIADLEAKIAALSAPKAPEAPTPPPKFEKPAPKFESFTGDDPLPEFIHAAGAYGAEKHAADAAQARFEAEQKAYEEQTRNAFIAKTQESARRYSERLTPFKAAHPDFDAAIAPLMQGGIPPVLELACLEDDKGPEFAYALGTQPGLRAEMLLLSDGRAITENNVAMLRQVLASRMQAVVPQGPPDRPQPPSTVYTPPKPPNPVRTGPTRTGDELPDDDASLAAHERAFHRRR